MQGRNCGEDERWNCLTTLKQIFLKIRIYRLQVTLFFTHLCIRSTNLYGLMTTICMIMDSIYVASNYTISHNFTNKKGSRVLFYMTVSSFSTMIVVPELPFCPEKMSLIVNQRLLEMVNTERVLYNTTL